MERGEAPVLKHHAGASLCGRVWRRLRGVCYSRPQHSTLANGKALKAFSLGQEQSQLTGEDRAGQDRIGQDGSKTALLS